jgi:hypothetical protein
MMIQPLVVVAAAAAGDVAVFSADVVVVVVVTDDDNDVTVAAGEAVADALHDADVADLADKSGAKRICSYPTA